MSEVKWVKLTTDMFDNRKIKHLRKLPDGNNIVLVWVMLLTMAGRCNAGGMIFLTENIPYTPNMLADELGFEDSTVLLALEALERLNMISSDPEGFISIAGWEEYQNLDGMEKIREQNRIRKQNQRMREKQLECDGHVTVTQSHATDIDKDIDIDKDKDIDNTSITNNIELKDNIKDTPSGTPYQLIADLYNQLCPSLPKVTTLSNSRRKAIKARFRVYHLEDFQLLFEKAEASAFLKGGNDRNWSANFDWLIKDSNMAKVLDGNYDDKNSKPINGKARELDEFYQMAAGWAEGDTDG